MSKEADPAARVIHALNEFSAQIQHRSTQWLGIGFEFIDIDRSMLTVRVWSQRNARPVALAVEVRNVVLMLLQDLVPCAALRIVSDEPSLERTVEFVRARDLGRRLPSSLILIEEVIGPKRAAMRARVREWFDGLAVGAVVSAEPIPEDEPAYERIDDLIARLREDL